MLKTVSKLSVLLALMALLSSIVSAEKISAYYNAPFADVKSVKAKLKKAGFELLTTYSPAAKEDLKVIVFTNDVLKANAGKKRRGFAAIQRVMVDTTAKTVTVTNPTYWLKAFMQTEYQTGVDTKIKTSLSKALGQLTATKDILEESDLAEYHFMMAMPYYHDMLEIKSGEDLASKVNAKKKLFEITLSNGSTLLGVKMSKSSENFIDKIGTQNAILLPYTLLIEDGKAYALHAKYYLALSYPLLTMGEFMTISSTPDAIERKLKKSFK
jgi:hypothetical protein